MSSDFLLKRSLRFSRFFFRSSYFLTPNTSLYAELSFLFSSIVFVSASATILSESKKKKRAMSLLRIKSLMKTSLPISFDSSFGAPSMKISVLSLSSIESYDLVIFNDLQGIEGIKISANSIVIEHTESLFIF